VLKKYLYIFLTTLIIIKPLESSAHHVSYNDFSDFVITSWFKENGLPSNFISDIKISPTGFVWAATTQGLSKFDGSHFYNYTKSLIKGLETNDFICIDINKSGNLIAGTSNSGVVEFKSGKFTHFKISDNPIENIVYDIAFLDDDEYLIATQSGLFIKNKDELEIADTSFKGIPVYDIELDLRNEIIYLGTMQGVLAYNYEFNIVDELSITGESYGSVRKVFIDGKNSKWIGTNKSVFRVDSMKISKVLDDVSVYDITEDTNQQVWIATYDGLFVLRHGKVFNLTKEYGLSDNRIRSLNIDKENDILWIGAYNGLNSISQSIINTINKNNGLNNDEIRAILEDKNGNIWLGTNGNGLYKYNKTSETLEQILYLKDFATVWSLYENDDGTIWAGSVGKIASINNYGYEVFSVTGHEDEDIRVIIPSNNREDYFVLGTNKGNIVLSNGSSIKRVHGSSRIKESISKIYSDTDSTMYICTQVGLFIFKDNTSKRITVADGLPSNSIRSIYVDDNGIKWLGTGGGGLVRYDGKEFFSFSIEDGLFSKDVWYIVEDNNDNFWMSCDEGIFLVNKQNLEDYRLGKVESLTSLSFGIKDGMKNTEGTTSSNAGLLDSDGNVWFSNMDGAVWFDPEELLSKKRDVEVYIEKIIADDDVFLNLSDIELSKDVENIEIYYGVKYFGNISDLYYQYRLDNYNSQWVNTDKRQVAYFGQLLPGDHTFNVKAGFGFKRDNYHTASFEFYRPPSIWETIYFQIFLILATLSFVFIFINYRVKKIRKRNKELLLEIRRRKRAEKELISSEEKYKRLFDNSAFGIYRTTIDGRFLTANKSALDILGFNSLKELQNIQIPDAFYKSKEDRQYFINVLLQNGAVYEFENQIIRNDGKKIWIREAARLVKDEKGNVIIEGGFEGITERNEYKDELIAAKEKAEKSDRLKSEFLAQMSHEIRTPVNTILSYNSLIKDELEKENRHKFDDYFSSINSGSRRLIKTIDSILNLSQLQAGSYEVIKSKLYLNEICSEIYTEFKQSAEEKGLLIELKESENNFHVLGDHYSLTQMLVNLVDNSIKYTQKGKILISVTNNEEEKSVLISDTGIGMSEDYIENLYDPFTQEETGYSRRFEGTGLGLTLVKYYAELNNAHIELESKKNEGTSFKIIFSDNEN
jgi:PAS domain S-box-containing protein